MHHLTKHPFLAFPTPSCATNGPHMRTTLKGNRPMQTTPKIPFFHLQLFKEKVGLPPLYLIMGLFPIGEIDCGLSSLSRAREEKLRQCNKNGERYCSAIKLFRTHLSVTEGKKRIRPLNDNDGLLIHLRFRFDYVQEK